MNESRIVLTPPGVQRDAHLLEQETEWADEKSHETMQTSK